MMATETKTAALDAEIILEPEAHLPASSEHRAPEQRRAESAAADDESFHDLLAPWEWANRDLLNREVISLYRWGSNGLGFELNLPDTPHERMQMLGRIPEVPRLIKLETSLRRVLRRRTSYAEATTVVLGGLALCPNVKIEDRRGFIIAMARAIALEADLARWAPCVVAAGFYIAVRQAGFVPSLKEVLEGCEKARGQFETALGMVDRIAEGRTALEQQLIRDGLLPLPGTDDDEDWV